MKLQHLKTLIAVIESRGVSRAAAQLNTSQPAVSAAIKALEQDLGATLFERPRGSRAVRPTKAAMTLAVHARDILQRCEEARKSVAEPDRRPPKIRFGVLFTLAAGDIAAAHAGLVLEAPAWRWSLSEGTQATLSVALRGNGIDIAWTVVEPGTANTRVLWHEPYVAMVAKSHPLAKAGRPSIAVADLDGYQIVLRGRCELQRNTLRDAGLTIRPAARAERDDLALSLVAQGLGYAIAPRSLATSDVAALAVRDLGLSRPIGLKWRRDTPPDAVDAVSARLAA